MGDDLWIVVPNWDKFQHYGNRRDAPWIKLYNELNSRVEWLELSVAERGLLVTVWIEYSRSGGAVRRSFVQQLCRGSAREQHWESLNHAGFIHFSASKPLALRALAREEVEKEKKVLSATASKTEQRLPFNGPAKPDPPRMNAGAYKPFKDETEEPFDEEAWIAEVSARAHASPRRAPIQDPILTEPLEPDQRMVDLAKDWLDASR